MKNPYADLSHPFDPEKFFGSREWVETILSKVSGYSPVSMEFRGLPTMGKSFLSRYMADPKGALSRDQDLLLEPYNKTPEKILMILIEFRKTPSQTHPFIFLYSKFRTFIQEHGDLSAYIQELPETDQVSEDEAVEIIGTVIRKLAADQFRIVFLFDDFDLIFATLDNDKTTLLRPWVDDVSFIISTEKGLELVNPRAVGSPFFSILNFEYVGGISEQEANRIIDHSFKETGISFPQEDINYLHKQAGKHPFLMIRACQELWDYRKKRGLLTKTEPLSGRDISFFHNKLRVKFARIFLGYINTLTEEERFALKTVLEGQEEGAEEPIALPILEDLGLLEYDTVNEKYHFFSPLFEEFLKNLDFGLFIKETKPNGKEKKGKKVGFSQRERKLYNFLRENPGEVRSFKEIAEEVMGVTQEEWQDENTRQRISHNITVYITRLRKKLDADESITSDRGVGYSYDQFA